MDQNRNVHTPRGCVIMAFFSIFWTPMEIPTQYFQHVTKMPSIVFTVFSNCDTASEDMVQKYDPSYPGPRAVIFLKKLYFNKEFPIMEQRISFYEQIQS